MNSLSTAGQQVAPSTEGMGLGDSLATLSTAGDTNAWFSRRPLNGSYVYPDKRLLSVGTSDRALAASSDARWLRQLLYVAQTLFSEYKDRDAEHWLLLHKDDVTRRLKQLDSERLKRQYVVQYEKREPATASLPSTMTIEDYRAQPSGATLATCSTEDFTEVDLQTAVRPVFPNRGFHASDICRYPHLELTNVIGLDVKEQLRRTQHQHRCIRCGTAEPCMFRYFSDGEDEFHYKEKRQLHERTVGYDRCQEAAVIVANGVEQLYSEQRTTQLEKDLAHRHELATAASEALSATHRLRQEGLFVEPGDEALVYPKAFQRAHAEGKLPPISRGDGHEGHFYL